MSKFAKFKHNTVPLRKALIREAESVTARNDRRTLNVAFAYTSREEMAQVS